MRNYQRSCSGTYTYLGIGECKADVGVFPGLVHSPKLVAEVACGGLQLHPLYAAGVVRQGAAPERDEPATTLRSCCMGAQAPRCAEYKCRARKGCSSD